jgi:hypothetical protein
MDEWEKTGDGMKRGGFNVANVHEYLPCRVVVTDVVLCIAGGKLFVSITVLKRNEEVNSSYKDWVSRRD